MSKMFALGALLVLGVRISKASGLHWCKSNHQWISSNYCTYDQYCCGVFKNECCNYVESDISYDVTVERWASLIGILVTLIIIAVVLICCRVCCKSTTQGGVVLRAPSTTTVPLNSPPQQLYYPPSPNYTSAVNTENSSCLYSLPGNQDSARSNNNMPPPAYNQAAGVQL